MQAIGQCGVGVTLSRKCLSTVSRGELVMSEPSSDSAFDAPNSPAPRSRWRRYGRITLLCLIPVALVAGLLWRPVMQAREASHRSNCKCGLKQLGLALHNYHDTYGTFPPAMVLGPDQRPWHSWRVLILPFLEQQALYAEYRFDEPWDGPNNRKLLEKMPLAYVCPSRPCPVDFAKPPVLAFGVLACGGTPEAAKRGFTSYAAVLGQNCAFRGTQPVTIHEFTDGVSSTAMVGECTRTKIPWTKPEDIDTAFFSKIGDPNGFSSPHGGGGHFLMGDGTVQFVKTSLQQTTVDAIFTRNGGETVREF